MSPANTPAIWGPYHSFVDFREPNLLPGIVVPQKTYTAQQPYTQLKTIKFSEQGKPLAGVKLRDALGGNIAGLASPTREPQLAESARKVTIRINWPGYNSWHDIMHIYDHTYDLNPITMQKLVVAVAQKIKLCIEDLAQGHSTDPRPDWWITQYPIERLALVELRHVSAGSWQPVLCVVD